MKYYCEQSDNYFFQKKYLSNTTFFSIFEKLFLSL